MGLDDYVLINDLHKNKYRTRHKYNLSTAGLLGKDLILNFTPANSNINIIKYEAIDIVEEQYGNI
jgi:hypothetical protein